MKFTARQTTSLPKSTVLVLAFFQKQKSADHPWWPQLPAPVKKVLTAWLKQKHTSLDFQKSEIFHFADGQFPTVVVLGLGERRTWNDRHDRLLARRLVRLAHEQRWSQLMVAVQRMNAASAQLMTENMIMADYDFHQYRQTPPSGWPKVQSVTFLVKKKDRGIDQAIRQGQIIGEMVNQCRDLSNTPGGIMTPKLLAAAARRLGKLPKVRTKVLGGQQMKKLKMGGVLGVAEGSDQPPQFIIMEYHGVARSHHPGASRHPSSGRRGEKPLVLVGKGVTFDSGGLNIKPGDHMNEMHMDMSGGAAVVTAIAAIAKLKLPVNVVGLVPAVENMPSGSGYRPGDLLKSMSGKVIEVGNTDAEGRVILADALTYAQKYYKPALVVDVATLTGAALAALGQQATAMFVSDELMIGPGQKLGEMSGDYVWPLPLWEEYEPDIKGTFGDVSNSGKSRSGGAINGAMFLYQFIKQTPWIHLDIAPTMTAVEGQHLAKGAAGAGVRWLVELAKHFKNGKVSLG